jgi:hypothetical protein
MEEVELWPVFFLDLVTEGLPPEITLIRQLDLIVDSIVNVSLNLLGYLLFLPSELESIWSAILVVTNLGLWLDGSVSFKVSKDNGS